MVVDAHFLDSDVEGAVRHTGVDGDWIYILQHSCRTCSLCGAEPVTLGHSLAPTGISLVRESSCLKLLLLPRVVRRGGAASQGIYLVALPLQKHHSLRGRRAQSETARETRPSGRLYSCNRAPTAMSAQKRGQVS